MHVRYLREGLAFIVVLIVAGVVGFMELEHESFLDAVLTTVSAISTVGYSPPHPLSAAGKILAIVLILGGLSGIAFVISVLTEYFMEGHLQGAWERTRMDRAIAKLRDHFIIVGFGRVGTEVARQLQQAGHSLVVVDINEEPIQSARSAGYLFCQAEASDDDVLRAVGVERAQGLIACADSDVRNVYVTLAARAINPGLYIVARAAHADAEPKLYHAGANRVVSPYVMAGRQIAQIAAQTRLADHLSLPFDGKQIDVRIVELRTEDMPQLVGQSVSAIHNHVLQGAFVLAVDRGQERMMRVSPDEIVRAGDRLLVVGSGATLEKLATIT